MPSGASSVSEEPEYAWEVATLFPSQGDWGEEAYLSLTDSTNKLIELADGRLEFVSMPTEIHQALVQFLFLSLHAFVSKNLSGNFKIRHIVAIGSAYEEVLKVASDIKVDLIVIGASKPDLKDYLLGPNAARVARHAKVSVYIVRG